MENKCCDNCRDKSICRICEKIEEIGVLTECFNCKYWEKEEEKESNLEKLQKEMLQQEGVIFGDKNVFATLYIIKEKVVESIDKSFCDLLPKKCNQNDVFDKVKKDLNWLIG